MEHTAYKRINTWRHFRQSRLAFAALLFLGLLLMMALLAGVLANSRPLMCRYNGVTHFPAFSANRSDSIFDPMKKGYRYFTYQTADWRSLPMESALWAPIPYSPDFLDLHNDHLKGPFEEQQFVSPKGELTDLSPRFRHWLGTTQSGQDVLSGLIHGTRVSLFIGIGSMGLAAMIGIFLGVLTGYFGDHRFFISRGSYYLILPLLFLAYFYGFYTRRYPLLEAGEEGIGMLMGQVLLSLFISLGVIGMGLLLSRGLRRIPFFARPVTLPLDSLILRGMEILRSVPVILILIAFSILFKGSLWFVTLAIGLTGWTGIARLMRAELIRINRLSYLEAARALGMREWRMIFRHALPNGMAPVLVAITFGIASAIIVESGLSFLNLGVGEQTITWGKLLQKGRSDMGAWWLTLFPALAIFLTVLSLNLVGERLRDVLDPQLAGVEKKV